MKQFFSRLAKLYGDIRYFVLDLLDYYFPRPVVIDEQGRRVIYGRTGDIYYLPDPNSPKGKWYVIVGDSEIDEDEVIVSFRGNPITGEEVHYFPGWYENVPRDERMTESEYARLLQQHCQMPNGSTPVSENTQPNRDNPHGIEQA